MANAVATEVKVIVNRIVGDEVRMTLDGEFDLRLINTRPGHTDIKLVRRDH